MEALDPPRQPWWRVPMVWLVIGGPAVVVVAGVATTVLAVHGADPVLPTGATQARASAPTQATQATQATAPALVGRNHAATGR